MQPGNLVPHPEGGSFREVFRSAVRVQRTDGVSRSALTHIYFALAAGEVSAFHRVDADEVWNLYRGGGLRLYLWDGSESVPETIELSAQTEFFCHVVPRGIWQAAEPLTGDVLVGCSVGPGFEFEDFELLRKKSPEAADLADIDPAWLRFCGTED